MLAVCISSSTEKLITSGKYEEAVLQLSTELDIPEKVAKCIIDRALTNLFKMHAKLATHYQGKYHDR